MTTAPITAIVISKDPNESHMAMTINSLANQDQPPAEVIFVDSTSHQHALKNMGGCALCTQALKEAIQNLKDAGTTVVYAHNPSAGLGEARDIGIKNATQPAIWHLDEDAVITDTDWTTKVLKQLDQKGVVAVGGNVAPLRDNGVGKVFASLDAATQFVPGGWYITHPKALCTGDACVWPGQHRGEDKTLRNHLSQRGTLVRDQTLLAKKDLPTNRQHSLLKTVVGASGGAVSGILASKLFDAAENTAQNTVLK